MILKSATHGMTSGHRIGSHDLLDYDGLWLDGVATICSTFSLLCLSLAFHEDQRSFK